MQIEAPINYRYDVYYYYLCRGACATEHVMVGGEMVCVVCGVPYWREGGYASSTLRTCVFAYRDKNIPDDRQYN